MSQMLKSSINSHGPLCGTILERSPPPQDHYGTIINMNMTGYITSHIIHHMSQMSQITRNFTNDNYFLQRKMVTSQQLAFSSQQLTFNQIYYNFYTSKLIQLKFVMLTHSYSDNIFTWLPVSSCQFEISYNQLAFKYTGCNFYTSKSIELIFR